jgi:hypothetical protein
VPTDAKLLTRGIASDVPQFSSPRLHASFLINCGRLLVGRIHAARFHVGGLATIETAPNDYVKRVAGSDFRSPKGTVIYECSTELQGLLAALTPERADELAVNWHDMYGSEKTKWAKPNGRTQVRSAILENLAALALQGKESHAKLMLRVEYKRQR